MRSRDRSHPGVDACRPSRTQCARARAPDGEQPASDAMSEIPPASGAASTPPAADSGSEASISPARRQLATAACSSRKMPTSATAPQAEPAGASELRDRWRRRTPPRGTRTASASRATWRATSAATSAGSPVTPAATSTLRSTSSWMMAAGSARTVRLATSLRRHLAAARRVDQQVPELGQVAARLRRAPDHHVEDLRLLVEVAHDQARGERGRVPADVAGPQAVLLRGREVDLDVTVGCCGIGRDHGMRHAGHLREHGPHVLRLAAGARSGRRRRRGRRGRRAGRPSPGRPGRRGRSTRLVRRPG